MTYLLDTNAVSRLRKPWPYRTFRMFSSRR
jgi:predicted nucleic acid-binding protein